MTPAQMLPRSTEREMGPLEGSVAISLGIGNFRDISSYPTSLEGCILTIRERNLQLHRKHPFSGNLSASFPGSFEPDLGMWEGIPSQAEVINRISNPPPLMLAG